MIIKKNYLEISYGIIILLFLITSLFYIKRPKLKILLLDDSTNSSKNIIKLKVNFDITNKIKRKINIGETYLIKTNKGNSFQITNIAIWKNNDFNLFDYYKYLPQLIISDEQLIIKGKNNYALQKLLTNTKYQTCYFDIDDQYYLYKSDPNREVHRYNNYSYWRYVYKKEIKFFINPISNKSYNCLLVTGSNPHLFDNNLLTLKEIIKKHFIYY